MESESGRIMRVSGVKPGLLWLEDWMGRPEGERLREKAIHKEGKTRRREHICGAQGCPLQCPPLVEDVRQDTDAQTQQTSGIHQTQAIFEMSRLLRESGKDAEFALWVLNVPPTPRP